MTDRNEFAMAALAGMLSNRSIPLVFADEQKATAEHESTFGMIARACYAIADAMLEAQAKTRA